MTAQRPTTDLDPHTGRATRGVMVSFRTGMGNSGEVFVPQATYDRGPAAVKPTVEAAARNIDAIHQLSG